LTHRDETANLELHERIVFCHILDMRENMDKKKVVEDSSKEVSNSETQSIKERIQERMQPMRKVGRPVGSTKLAPKLKHIKKSPKFPDAGEQFRKNLSYLERTELTGYK
jgi:23S rRNA pseudoU1915 N3-methylase RlmH